MSCRIISVLFLGEIWDYIYFSEARPLTTWHHPSTHLCWALVYLMVCAVASGRDIRILQFCVCRINKVAGKLWSFAGFVQHYRF